MTNRLSTLVDSYRLATKRPPRQGKSLSTNPKRAGSGEAVPTCRIITQTASLALLGVKRQRRPAIVALGLFGAALIYGDGAITPAISVLSALEGMTIAAPGLGPYVVPMAVAILVALFAIQSQGTARIGHAFGPVMAAWFGTIALLGVWGITKHPTVLLGLDPRYAISYLAHDGFRAFAVLGGVFLCVTGAEALYADMGHFGATPIRVAWSVSRRLPRKAMGRFMLPR
jgi:KUP system potassium uptake protein